MQPEPGRVVAGWRLIRRLGEGAQSQVWLALRAPGLASDLPSAQQSVTPPDQPTAQPAELAALKLLPLPAGPGQAEAASAFLAQAAIAGSLEHPGIARVHDAGVEGAVAWLAMEPVAGTDLQRYTQPARLLPAAVVLGLLERVAQALAHAHGRGVFHRDLKPANVIVDWAGDAVKLVDFGIAHAEGGVRTGTGVVPGTPAYMAPELLAGAAPDARSDLYALGVMAFELLSGQRPHEARTLGELLRQVAHEAAPPLPRPGGLPDDAAALVAGIVASLLVKPLQQRAADAGTVAQALAQAQRMVTLAAGARGAPSHLSGSRAP